VPLAIVRCKADLETAGQPIPESAKVLLTSAERSDGIRELIDWVTRRLIPSPPTLKTPLPVAGSAEFCEALLERLERGASLGELQRDLEVWLAGSLGITSD
jgi:hypothetical protein